MIHVGNHITLYRGLDMETSNHFYRMTVGDEGDGKLYMPSLTIDGGHNDQTFWDNEEYIFGILYESLVAHSEGKPMNGNVEADLEEAGVPEADYPELLILLNEAIKHGFNVK